MFQISYQQLPCLFTQIILNDTYQIQPGDLQKPFKVVTKKCGPLQSKVLHLKMQQDQSSQEDLMLALDKKQEVYMNQLKIYMELLVFNLMKVSKKYQYYKELFAIVISEQNGINILQINFEFMKINPQSLTCYRDIINNFQYQIYQNKSEQQVLKFTIIGLTVYLIKLKLIFLSE